MIGQEVRVTYLASHPTLVAVATGSLDVIANEKGAILEIVLTSESGATFIPRSSVIAITPNT